MVTHETAEPVTPTSEPENQWDRKRLIKFDGSMFNRRSIIYWELSSQILNTFIYIAHRHLFSLKNRRRRKNLLINGKNQAYDQYLQSELWIHFQIHARLAQQSFAIKTEISILLVLLSFSQPNFGSKTLKYKFNLADK